MKKWITIGILVVLVIGMVLISGCTSTAPAATPTPQIVYVTVLVTPTPTLTPKPTVVPAQDPIIGVWTFDMGQHGIDETSYKIKYIFKADGTYLEGGYVGSQNIQTDYGTWVAQSDNLYLLHDISANRDKKMRYDPVNKSLNNAN